jgi:MoaA/NifB/PqqE/SkfB family radical SAM enzyme
MKDTYCHHPFHQVAMKDFFGSELQVAYPCCHMGNNTDGNKYFKKQLEIENLTKLTPDEIFNSSRFQELRNNLKNGVRDSACSVCWNQEDRGIKSYRQFSNDSWYDTSDETLSNIDITIGNQCNLRCRMCSPVASNLLYQDIKFFKENDLVSDLEDAVNIKLLGAFTIETTKSIQWNWLLNNTDKIKVIKASGGEPFYDKKMIELLHHYVKTGNAKNTILKFHTNATQFNQEIVDILNEFKQNDHVFSVDGVGKVYECIRYPATFNDLNSSIDLYNTKVKNKGNLDFTIVVSAYNILNIKDYVQWARSIDQECNINFQEVYPIGRGISPRCLSKDILELALERVKEYNLTTFNGIVNDAITNNQENYPKLLKEITLFDKSRNQSYKDYIDENILQHLKEQ